MIDIKGLPKGLVLQALYNAADAGEKKPTLSLAEADALVAHKDGKLVFREVNGRKLHVILIDDFFDSTAFDRANGRGAARAAIDTLTAKKRGL